MIRWPGDLVELDRRVDQHRGRARRRSRCPGRDDHVGRPGTTASAAPAPRAWSRAHGPCRRNSPAIGAASAPPAPASANKRDAVRPQPEALRQHDRCCGPEHVERDEQQRLIRSAQPQHRDSAGAGRSDEASNAPNSVNVLSGRRAGSISSKRDADERGNPGRHRRTSRAIPAQPGDEAGDGPREHDAGEQPAHHQPDRAALARFPAAQFGGERHQHLRADRADMPVTSAAIEEGPIGPSAIAIPTQPSTAPTVAMRISRLFSTRSDSGTMKASPSP